MVRFRGGVQSMLLNDICTASPETCPGMWKPESSVDRRPRVR